MGETGRRGGAATTGSQSRAERKERTRQRLLEVTLDLVAQRGLAGLSLREVSRAAGIVPTAFYRHFPSLDALGVELVDESMRPLRQLIRDVRRDRTSQGDIIEDTVQLLAAQVRAHPDQFRFLARERYGGVTAVRRAIAAELRLVTSDLAVDLARLMSGADWSATDLEMAANLMVTLMLGRITDLLDADPRHPEDADATLDLARRQLRLIALGIGAWRSSP